MQLYLFIPVWHPFQWLSLVPSGMPRCGENGKLFRSLNMPCKCPFSPLKPFPVVTAVKRTCLCVPFAIRIGSKGSGRNHLLIYYLSCKLLFVVKQYINILNNNNNKNILFLKCFFSVSVTYQSFPDFFFLTLLHR